MAYSLCKRDEGRLNKLKILTIYHLLRDPLQYASSLSSKLGLTPRQIGKFVKRIDCVDKKKKYNRNRYYVDFEFEKVPVENNYGDFWIKIEEYDSDENKYRIKTSGGEQRIITTIEVKK